MICPNCSSNIPNDAKFCPVCGKSTAQAPSAVVENVPPVAPIPPQAPYENPSMPPQGEPMGNQMPPQYRPEQQAPQNGQMPPKKSNTGLIIGLSIVAVLLIGVATFLLWPKPTPSVYPESEKQEATEMPDTTATPEPTPMPTPEPTPEPTPVPTPKSNLESSYNAFASEEASNFTRIYFEDSSASSNYVGDSGFRYAKYAIDDTAITCWQEGAEGSGVGESLELFFDNTETIHYLEFEIGHQSNSSNYDKNNRPAEITLTFSDGSSTKVVFEDTMDTQTVYFEKGVKTSKITITINSVYEGNKYEECCIAEVRAFSKNEIGNEEPDFLGVHKENYPETSTGYNKFLNDYTSYVLASDYEVSRVDDIFLYFCIHDEIALIKVESEYSQVFECYCEVYAYYYEGKILMMTERDEENELSLLYYFDEDGKLTHYYITGESTQFHEGDNYGDYNLQEKHDYFLDIYDMMQEDKENNE